MDKRFVKIISFFILIIVFGFGLIACDFIDNNNTSKEYVKVQFIVDDEVVSEYKLVKGSRFFTYSDQKKDNAVFLGWDYNGDGLADELPQTAETDLVIVALFKPNGSYTVTFYNDNATILYVCYVTEGEDATYGGDIPTKSPTVDLVYTFSKWDIEFTNVRNNLNVYAQYSSNTRSYTYIFLNGDNEISKDTIDYNTEIVIPSNPSKASTIANYYTFVGWDYNNDGEVDVVPTNIDNDYTFVAVYDTFDQMYNYKIYDSDGIMIKNVTIKYNSNIDYPEMNYKTKGMSYEVFVGWDYNKDGIVDEKIEVISSEMRIDAIYTDSQMLIMTYNNNVNVIYQEEGSNLQLLDPEVAVGYICKWYLDEEYTTPLANLVMINGILNIYGRPEQAVNLDTSLLDYVDLGEIIPVNNQEELQIIFNYLVFNKIKSRKILFGYSITNDMVADILETLMDGCPFDGYGINSSFSQIKKEITLNFSYLDNINTISNEAVYVQYASVNHKAYPNTRGSSFDDFYINNVEKTYNVNSSEQLFYVLEHGYRPIIASDNISLLNLYNKMKDVLRLIIDDGMTDIEKTLAIYEWLILEVGYDGNTFSSTISGNTEVNKYHCFYLEGVFNDHLAVCSGISKAFCCLANMEGIPCIYVSGQSVTTLVNHAWNKVFIDKNWYICDATSGGTIVNSDYEILNHQFFMISDNEFNTIYRQDEKSFPGIIAPISYNYYSNFDFIYNLKKYTLECTNKDTLTNYISYLYTTSGTCTIDINISFDYGTDMKDEIQNALNKSIRLFGESRSFSWSMISDDILVLVLKNS